MGGEVRTVITVAASPVVKSAVISQVLFGSSDLTASPARFVLWTSALDPLTVFSAHRRHGVTLASIFSGSSPRNQPLGRLGDRHHRTASLRGRLRTKASMWRSPVDAASCPASGC